MRTEPGGEFTGLSSIRGKLMGLMALVLLPILLLQIWSWWDEYQTHIEDQLEISQELAYTLEGAFSNLVSDLLRSADMLGQTIQFHYAQSNAVVIKGLLEYGRGLTPIICAYSWITPDGRIYSSTAQALLGADLSHRPFYPTITGGADEYISDLSRCGIIDTWEFAIAKAIRDPEGSLLGILSITVDAQRLSEILIIRRTGERSVGLVDRNLRVVYRSGSNDKPVQSRTVSILGPAYKTLTTGEPAVIPRFQESGSGSYLLGAAVPVGGMGWVAYAVSPRSAVLAPFKLRMLRSIMVFLVIIGLSFAGTLLVSTGYIVRIERLREMARRLSWHQWDARAIVEGKDEIAVTTSTFNAMAERISQLERERMTFLQVMAHELRNPMTAIKAGFSLIQSQLRTGESHPILSPVLTAVGREIDRLAHLIDEVVNAFRFQRTEAKLTMEACSLNQIIEEVLSVARLADPQRVFETQGLEREYTVMGDCTRLGDVVRNLVSNAVKYSNPESPIAIGVAKDDEQVTLSVRDEGEGIPEQELDQIFEIFYRSKHLRGKDPGGMGLGLYICREIVLQHGGRIWVETRAGQGSTFFVQLPRVGGDLAGG